MECCRDFAEVFDPIIQDYHGISKDAVHNSDMDVTKIKVCGNTEIENIRNFSTYGSGSGCGFGSGLGSIFSRKAAK
jgi:hypothetical protein